MTTEKLIEELRDYAEIFETEGKDDEDLERLAAIITESAKKLEMAYAELENQGFCITCKYSKFCLDVCPGDDFGDRGCNDSRKWQWEGDVE